MRIALVSLHFVEYALELANALARNHEVLLILSSKEVDRTLGAAARFRCHDGVRLLVFPERGGLLRYPLFLVRWVWLQFRFRPEVLHVQESAHLATLIFLFIRKARLVVTVHDVDPHPGKQAEALRRGAVYRLMTWFRRSVYRKVIVHAEALKRDYIRRYGRAAADIHVVPHAVLTAFRDGKQAAEEEPYTVLLFGRMQDYKGLHYMVSAAPRLCREIPDIKIVVAGQGASLDACRETLVADPHFEVHDRFIPNEEVPRFFERAAVVVLPYTEASSSGIAAMAYAFGKPVVATDVGGLPEMVLHGQSGLIVPARDPDRLCDAVVRLLRDPQMRRRFGDTIRGRIRDEFGWDKIAHRTHEVYEDAMARTGVAPQ